MTPPVVHIEFKSINFARTSAFYSRVFNWKTEQNGSGSYMKLEGADAPSAGWVRADLVQSPGPITFLTVEDLTATLDEIEGAGGRVLVRSMPFAGGGEIALFADPDDNVLGLWRRKPGGAAGGEAPVAAPKAVGKPAAKPATTAVPAATAAKAPAAAPTTAAAPAPAAPKPASKAKKKK